MQTEAAPREPFTLGVLFRYKVTVFAVAALVILGGYVRIITQPLLYQATARLAVRFTSEAIALSGVDSGNFFRLPLLEEEVKAYMVQLKDEEFVSRALDALPSDAGELGAGELGEEPTAAQRFRAQFLSAYYAVRKGLLSLVDALLFTSDLMISEKEQRVRQVLARLEVTAGTEASHIITVNYQCPKPALAAQVVNTLCLKFIEQQKKKVKKKDEEKAQKGVDEAMKDLVENRRQLFEVTNKLGSPTIEEGIRGKYQALGALTERKARLETAKKLLDQGIIPYERDLPLESPILSAELEQQYFQIRMGYEESKSRVTEAPEYWDRLLAQARKHMDERRAAAIARDRTVVEQQIKALGEDISKALADPTLTQLSPEYTRLFAAQAIVQARVTQAENELAAVKSFNKELVDENVSENVAFWQRAQVPPFPMPQHREVKLLLVVVLALFVGCLAALVRHQLSPRIVRRARPRSEEEVDVPLILLPDEAKRRAEKDMELDISFPQDEGAEKGSPGEVRR